LIAEKLTGYQRGQIPIGATHLTSFTGHVVA
jgi:hypothetical protein